MTLMIITLAVIVFAMCALAWHASTQVLHLEDRLGPRDAGAAELVNSWEIPQLFSARRRLSWDSVPLTAISYSLPPPPHGRPRHLAACAHLRKGTGSETVRTRQRNVPDRRIVEPAAAWVPPLLAAA